MVARSSEEIAAWFATGVFSFRKIVQGQLSVMFPCKGHTRAYFLRGV